MKTVGLFVLKNINNMGDEILGTISSRILYDINPDLQINNIEFQPRTWQLIKKGYIIEQMISVPFLGILKFFRNNNRKYRLLEIAYKIRFGRYFRNELRYVDAIIFGIGVVKYSTQHFSYPYTIISEISRKFSIPMMMWSQTIETYNAKDYRSEKIREFLNNPMLKMITTRDAEPGMRKLEDYLIRKDICAEIVGDRALLIPEYYKISFRKTNIIGINLVRGDIYSDYKPDSGFDEKALLSFYRELLNELDRRGMKWQLFSNGMVSDRKFGSKLIKFMDRTETLSFFEPHDEEDLISKIAGYQAIFGARFHACLIAYAMSVPVVGLAWDPKFVGLGQIMEVPEFFLNEDQINAKRIVDLIQAAIDREWDYTAREYHKKRILDTAKMFLEQNL